MSRKGKEESPLNTKPAFREEVSRPVGESRPVLGAPRFASVTPSEEKQTFLASCAIALAALAAYASSFAGVLVFDDVQAILANQSIRHLWPIRGVFSPPANGETVSGRPLLNLSLALNYAVGQTGVWGYHAVNLAIHICAALLLFGIVRRTLLLRDNKRNPFQHERETGGRGATDSRLSCCSGGFLAFSIALLWVVHPLQTESVTYIVQRAESLAGAFYMLTLYCAIRGSGDGDGKPLAVWSIASVAACLMGMATKEVMVTAPFVVLLYDRTFQAGSFREALRKRWGLYAGLAATWALLGYLVMSTRLLFRGAELHTPDRWSYACTQPGVLVYYLRLSIWPHPLCLDYEWPIARNVQDILPPAIIVGGLLAAALWGLLRNKPYGFLGAWFFLILAPTSSFIPLGQSAFEHRMYLPLAAVVTAVVMGVYNVSETLVFSARLRAMVLRCLLGGVGLALAILSWQRNNDYRDDVRLWQDVVVQRPNNARAHNNLGNALAKRGAGEVEEAILHYRKALEIQPDNVDAHNNLALVLAGRGEVEEAIVHYRKALEFNSDYAEVHNNLGIALVRRGGIEEAIEHYRKTLELEPDNAVAHNNLGIALARRGRWKEAIIHYRLALEINRAYTEAHVGLADALAGRGGRDEALAHYETALALTGAHNDKALADAIRARIGRCRLEAVVPGK